MNRSDVPKRRIDKYLTRDEKILYEKVLEDIAKNDGFYRKSSPEEITSHLIDVCGFDRDSIYKLFKKITLISEELDNNDG